MLADNKKHIRKVLLDAIYVLGKIVEGYDLDDDEIEKVQIADETVRIEMSDVVERIIRDSGTKLTERELQQRSRMLRVMRPRSRQLLLNTMVTTGRIAKWPSPKSTGRPTVRYSLGPKARISRRDDEDLA